MCTSARWLDLACAVGELLLGSKDDPIIEVRFDGSVGYSCLEINIPKQVRKASSREMTLGFRRGGFGWGTVRQVCTGGCPQE